VKRYIAEQAEHHGYSRKGASTGISFPRSSEPQILATAHSSFDLKHHLVLATKVPAWSVWLCDG